MVVRRRRVGDRPVRVDRRRAVRAASLDRRSPTACRRRGRCRWPGPRSLTAVSSAVVAASSTATGPSLTRVTVTLTVAVARAAVAVADRVGEAVRAVVVRRRRVGDRPVRLDRRRAVRGRASPRSPSACRRPRSVSFVRTVTLDRRVLGRRRRVVDRHRAVVDAPSPSR